LGVFMKKTPPGDYRVGGSSGSSDKSAVARAS
jgi:hypothetical protein